MHRLTEWFTKNPVAANLLMLLIIVGGIFTVKTIRIEGFPALPPSAVTITTIYPGANAEQIDRGVTRKIENALKGMNGIKKIRSNSFEGISSIWVQKTSDMDLDRFQNEIKSRVDAIYNMPQLAEKSIIAREEFTISALYIQVYSDLDELTIQKSAQLLKERLLDHPQISKLSLFGALEQQIRIEVKEEVLQSYGISLLQVAEAINKSSLDYRLGSLKSENGNILIRADRKAFEYQEFLDIPVITKQNGSRILLKDIAVIVDDFEEMDGFLRFQGKNTVGLEVFTSQKGHVIEVSEAVREVIKDTQAELPEGVNVDVWGETSVYMKKRLNLLATNAWQGLLIVFFLLALFLNIRLAFWVAMGIPISIAGTLAMMGERFLNFSLNEITTFGIILVLGILVDDAVVVGESVFEERTKMKSRLKGTLKGVHRVTTATVFGAFTTISAFYPLTLINNELAKVFASFAMIVVVAVLFSLAESKLILPAHLASIKNLEGSSNNFLSRWWNKIQVRTSKGLQYFIEKIYKPMLQKALKHKYSSLIAFFTFAMIGIMLIFNGYVRTVFFPQVPGNIISVNLKMNSGSSLKLTIDNIRKIETAIHEINSELEKETNQNTVKGVFVAVVDTYNGFVIAELEEEEDKALRTNEIIRLWRKKVGELEGTEKLTYEGTFETGGGFALELIAPDKEILKLATEEMKDYLSTVNGVHDITDDLSIGSPQFRLNLKPEAEHLNMSVNQLASQIGDAFGGLEIQRIQRGIRDVKVLVKYEKNQRKHIEDLLNSNIQTEAGLWVPLHTIADIQLETAEAGISRINGLISSEIKAIIDKDIIGAEDVFQMAKLFYNNELQVNYPGLKLKAGGELGETIELKTGMKASLIIILLLIYSLLAIPLKSYWKPFVIMSVIPFGFVGATYGHMITGHPLSLLSFFGMLAVMGVVVNDSLVMLTRFNDYMEEGMPLMESLINAGISRFRAIFLTTVTTISGLTPLMLETSEQAQYLIPAAISLSFGVLFATAITLFIIPLLLAVAYSFFGRINRPGSSNSALK